MYIKTDFTTIYADPEFIKEFAIERGAPGLFWVVLRYRNGDNVYVDSCADRDKAEREVYELGKRWMEYRLHWRDSKNA